MKVCGRAHPSANRSGRELNRLPAILFREVSEPVHFWSPLKWSPWHRDLVWAGCRHRAPDRRWNSWAQFHSTWIRPLLYSNPERLRDPGHTPCHDPPSWVPAPPPHSEWSICLSGRDCIPVPPKICHHRSQNEVVFWKRPSVLHHTVIKPRRQRSLEQLGTRQ